MRSLWMVLLALAVVISPAAGASKPEETARAFVNLLASGKFTEAWRREDQTMRAMLPEKGLKSAWSALTAQMGAYRRQKRVVSGQQMDYDIVLVTCEFQKGDVAVQVTLDRKGQVSGLFFRPAQTAPPKAISPPANAAFMEREVTVGSGEWKLPGTLTMPKGKGPFAAVVLVHGSGPGDRDETINPGLKPFRDLAWGLASRGIAVLRYEKRTKQYQARLAALNAPFTVKEETIDDALTAVSLVRSTPGVNAKRIFVVGHSLGAMLLPRIAQRDSRIAGLVYLTAPSRPLEDMVLDQMTYALSLHGPPPDDAKKQLAAIRRDVAKVKALKPSDAGKTRPLLLGAPPSYWISLRGYRPVEAAKRLRMPMLVLQGGRDYQVTTADYRAWQKAMAGRSNVTLKLYPSLNHCFVEGKGMATPAEYARPGHVAAPVIAEVAQWVKRR